MRDEVRAAVVAVLRRSAPTETFRWEDELRWWQRLLNWAARKIYTDASRVEVRPQSESERALVEEALRELAPASRCHICGGTELDDDPAAYYCHAVRYDGLPMKCKRCSNY